MKKISIKILFSIFVGIFSVASFANADNENITQVNFTSETQSIDQDVLSEVMSVQTQNIEGALEQLSETAHLSLSSTSETGIFYGANSSECTSELSSPFSLAMSSGSANKRFCYKDSTPGTYTITISVDDQDWVDATQEITINEIEVQDEESQDDESEDEEENQDEQNNENEESGDKSFSLILPASCNVVDLESNSHSFPAEDSPSDYLAVCALAKAQLENNIESFVLDDSEYGLYLTSLDGITPTESEYWALYLNDGYTECGIECLAIEEGDVLSFVLTNWEENTESTTIDITISSLETVEEISETKSQNKDFEITLDDTGCNVSDTVEVSHSFPAEDSPSDYLAVCALYVAKNSEQISGYELVDSEFGLYLQSLDGITPSETEYWALYLNDGYTECGIECLALVDGDVLSFVLSDWQENTESVEINITVSIQSSENQNNGGSGGGSISTNESFSVPLAIAYLKNVQGDDGSFANSKLYSDWVAIAYGAYGVSGSSKNLLLSYMKANNSTSSLLTDNERRAMAILSLGQDPYDFDGVDYINAILGEFDGNQFGDTSLVNDDIFAVLPLARSGYGEDDIEISNSIDFIINKQNANGSWENSVDVTAAAIQALSMFRGYGSVNSAISSAEEYMENLQQSDGGFESVYASAWALQAMQAINGDWVNGSNGIEDYFDTLQEDDGAVLPESESLANRIWGTAYAIPAMLGNAWGDIMDQASKPISGTGASSNTENSSNTNSTEEIQTVDISQNEWTDEQIEMVVKILSNNPDLVLVDTSIIRTDTNSNQNINSLNNIDNDEENIENNLDAENLLANTGNTGSNPSFPVVLGSIGGVVLIGYFVRRFVI